MKVREIYHNGEENIPPIFLIETPSKSDQWAETFEMIQPFLNHQNKVKISP